MVQRWSWEGAGVCGEIAAGNAGGATQAGIFVYSVSVGTSSGGACAGLLYPLYRYLNNSAVPGVAPDGVGKYIFGDVRNFNLTGDEYVESAIGGEVEGGIAWDAPGASSGEVKVGAQGGAGTRYGPGGKEKDFTFFKTALGFAAKTKYFDCSGGIEFKSAQERELKVEGFFAPLRANKTESVSVEDLSAMKSKAYGAVAGLAANGVNVPTPILSQMRSIMDAMPAQAAKQTRSRGRAGVGVELVFKWGGGKKFSSEVFLVLKAAVEGGIELGSAEISLGAEYGKKIKLN